MPQNQPLDTDKIRREITKILLQAIRAVKKLAKDTPNKPGPHGGATRQAKWFQVMAYLAQTINGLIQNTDLNETKKAIAEMKKQIAAIPDRDEPAPDPA